MCCSVNKFRRCCRCTRLSQCRRSAIPVPIRLGEVVGGLSRGVLHLPSLGVITIELLLREVFVPALSVIVVLLLHACLIGMLLEVDEIG